MVLFEQKCNEGYRVCNIRFSDFLLKDWLVNYAKKKYKISTFDKIQTNVMHINAEIGNLRMDQISKATLVRMIQRFEQGTAKNTNNCLSGKTISNILSIILSVFEYAKDLEILEKNPIENIRRPSAKSVKKDFYTIEDTNMLFKVLLEKAPVMYQTFYILALYSGMRLGEMCGLTWNDIDDSKKIVSVKQSVYLVYNNKKYCDIKEFQHKSGIEVNPPKTKSSVRVIKLPQIVFDFFNKLKNYYSSEKIRLGTAWSTNDDNVIFRSELGHAVSPPSMTHWLNNFAKKNNLKHICTHDFRHLNASLLIKNGCDAKTVQGLHGHAQASTTLDIYSY